MVYHLIMNKFDIIEYILQIGWLCLSISSFSLRFTKYSSATASPTFLFENSIKRFDVDRDAIRAIANDRYINEVNAP